VLSTVIFTYQKKKINFNIMKKYLLITLFFLLSCHTSYCQVFGWNPLPSETSSIIYCIDFANALTGWIACNDGLIKKTTNGGISWDGQFNDTKYIFYASYILNANTGWVAGVNTTSGSNGTILKTINGGTNWNLKYEGANTEVFNSIFFVNIDTGWVVGTGAEGGVIYKTIDGGENWNQQTNRTSFYFNGVHFANTLTGWIVASNSNSQRLTNCKILKTTNGGSYWFEQFPEETVKGLHSVYFITADTGWAVGDEGTIIKTTNGGVNWTTQISGTTQNLQSLHFPNAQTGWAVGSLGTILKTTNGGANWKVQSYYQPYRLYSIHFDNCLVGWAAGSGGTILKTISGGQNYISELINMTRNINKPITYGQPVYDTISIPPIGLRYVSDLNLALDTIINTPDSSLVLILYHEGIFDTLIYHAGGSGSDFIGTVLNDSANTLISNGTPPFTGQFKPYRPLSQFNNTQLRGDWIFITVQTAANNLRTGVIKSWSVTITYNNLIKIIKNGNYIPEFFKLGQNYPNPFNSTSKIKFEIADTKNGKFKMESNKVTLKIFDILGKEVTTLVNEVQSPGIYEVTWDASQYPSGIYFYSLETQNYKETKKMILIK
jgi:photosystem II stability/assembly factor-like uncharacterized protein